MTTGRGWPRLARHVRHDRAWSAVVLVASVAVFCLTLVTAGPARAGDKLGHIAQRAGGTLRVHATGLPAAQRPQVTVTGAGTTRTLQHQSLTIRNAKPGRYTVMVKRVRFGRAFRSARKGAVAYPVRNRLTVTVIKGKVTTVRAAYGAVVNPGVRGAPSRLLSVLGDPADPSGLIYSKTTRLPSVGTVMTAAPSVKLPRGLVVRVVASRRRGSTRALSVKSVPLAAAVPSFAFDGNLSLKAAPNARTSATSHASAGSAKRTCDGPKAFDIGVHLDELAVRHASASAWPPQMSFTLAARTTEHVGPKLLAAGVSCTWDLAELGPWQGAIPTPIGVPIPVYATIPVTASASVEGSLSAFRVNLASTSVLSLDVGRQNHAGFTQEGTNVWTDGVLQFSGTASLGANLSLELGVGSSKVGDLHVKAGIAPKATWEAGKGCDVGVGIGALSVGVKFGWLSAGTPPWSPATIHLWHGCQNGSGGSGPPPSGSGPPSSGAGPPPPPPPPGATRVNGYDNYGPATAGVAMCRGNPGRPESMPGGTTTQTFTVPAGVASIDTALVQIDPDSSVTAHLRLSVNGALRATADASAGGDTRLSFPAVAVNGGDSISVSVSFTASSGKIITVYQAGNAGGSFTASNSCPDGAPNVGPSANGLRAVLTGWSR